MMILSILFMRFMKNWSLITCIYTCFQFSLWDSLSDWRYHLLVEYFQFSLWDSLPIITAKRPLKLTFNSLYEILAEAVPSTISSPALSILFMRFFSHWPVNSSFFNSFNSLYEIPKSYFWNMTTSFENFQFSLWDSIG